MPRLQICSFSFRIEYSFELSRDLRRVNVRDKDHRFHLDNLNLQKRNAVLSKQIVLVVLFVLSTSALCPSVERRYQNVHSFAPIDVCDTSCILMRLLLDSWQIVNSKSCWPSRADNDGCDTSRAYSVDRFLWWAFFSKKFDEWRVDRGGLVLVAAGEC